MKIDLNIQDLCTIISALRNSIFMALENDRIDDCEVYSKLHNRLIKESGIEDFES